jgi:hypothetical protein
VTATAASVYDPEEIVSRYAKARNARVVAAALGCSERTIYRVVNRESPELRAVRVEFTDEEVSFIEYLLEDGASYTEVARTLTENRGPGGRPVTSDMLNHRWPGRGIRTASERLAAARAIRDFERLVQRLGLDDKEAT